MTNVKLQGVVFRCNCLANCGTTLTMTGARLYFSSAVTDFKKVEVTEFSHGFINNGEFSVIPSVDSLIEACLIHPTLGKLENVLSIQTAPCREYETGGVEILSQHPQLAEFIGLYKRMGDGTVEHVKDFELGDGFVEKIREHIMRLVESNAYDDVIWNGKIVTKQNIKEIQWNQYLQ